VAKKSGENAREQTGAAKAKTGETARRNKAAKNPPSRLHWFVENIESILSAILFALVIRAFIVEAFQIPTGSMATAFLGVHTNIKCANCGYEYAFGSNNGKSSPITFPGSSLCPVCQHRNFKPPRMKIISGDKILVSKYFNLFAPLERFQLVVFKSPDNLSTNYIKRVVSTGGERLQVLHGDVFINGRIASKPLKVQEQIWQPVYKSAYSQRRIASGRHWEIAPGSGWNESHGRFTYSGKTPSHIRLAGPIYDDHGYDDFNASSFARLNSVRGQGANPNSHIVGDLRIRATLAGLEIPQGVRQGAAEIGLEEDGVWYRLRAVVAEGSPVELKRLELVRSVRPAGLSPAFEELETVEVGGPAEGRILALANLDNFLYVWLDGKLVKKHWVERGAELGAELLKLLAEPAGKRDVDRLRKLIRTTSSGALLGTSGIGVTFANVDIDRDVYYYVPREPAIPSDGCGAVGPEGIVRTPATNVEEFKGRKLFDPETLTYIVPSDAFLVMGDNCHISKDSRWFGPVPDKYLLGKPFCIWWPPERIRLAR